MPEGGDQSGSRLHTEGAERSLGPWEDVLQLSTPSSQPWLEPSRSVRWLRVRIIIPDLLRFPGCYKETHERQTRAGPVLSQEGH